MIALAKEVAFDKDLDDASVGSPARVEAQSRLPCVIPCVRAGGRSNRYRSRDKGVGAVDRVEVVDKICFDISADLQELAQTPVTVVAAGAKAILDMNKTFEVLETLGVPVIAVGQDTLPAFWSAASDMPGARCWVAVVRSTP